MHEVILLVHHRGGPTTRTDTAAPRTRSAHARKERTTPLAAAPVEASAPAMANGPRPVPRAEEAEDAAPPAHTLAKPMRIPAHAHRPHGEPTKPQRIVEAGGARPELDGRVTQKPRPNELGGVGLARPGPPSPTQPDAQQLRSTIEPCRLPSIQLAADMRGMADREEREEHRVPQRR